MEMTTHDKRSIVLINKQFQIGQVAKFIAVHILALLIFGALIYLFLDSELDANLASAHVTYKNIRQMILPIVLTLSLLNILFSALLITFFVLYASHKIAGPLYRFKAAIDEVSHRNLRPGTDVRQGDQLHELASYLKCMIETLSEDLVTFRNKLKELKTSIAQQGEEEDLLGHVAEMEGIIDQYRT
jgi:nitrogen fixation/metabolism regulation signal transduction histidine kinase